MTEAKGANSGLVQREAELAALDRALQSAANGAGQLLVVEGPAGIGKTRLMAELRLRAAAEGFHVLAARGGEFEREFPFGLVHQLFEPLLSGADAEERGALLEGAAALAAPLVGAAESGPDDDASSFARVHGLYWLTANAAATSPLAILVDDVHWADLPTLRLLAYLARRLEGLPIVLAVAARPAEAGEGQPVLDAIAAEPLARVLALAPLNEDAVAVLVRDRLGDDAEPAFTRACHTATGGNPFLVDQLVGSLAADAVEPVAAAAARVSELGPPAVARTVLIRLGRLSPSALALARAVTVLGGGADLRRAAALAELGEADAADAADALADASILARARPLDFVHPIVRGAVYAELPAGERARAHARAARLLEDDGAPVAEVATHLLAADPAGDAWAVERLRAAGRAAEADGAPEAAVVFLERALREPPPADEQPDVLLELGGAETRAHAPGAIEHLRAARDRSPDPAQRARAALGLGRSLILTAQLADGADVLEAGAREVDGADRDLALRLWAELLGTARLDSSLRPYIVEHLPRLRELVAEGDDDGADCLILANLAWEDMLACAPAEEAAALAERALADGRMLRWGGTETATYMLAAGVLLYAERNEALDRSMAEAFAFARGRGSVLGFAFATLLRSYIALHRGELVEAEEEARRALEVMRDHPWAVVLLIGLGYLVDSLTDQGRLDDAEQALAAAGFAGDIPAFSPFAAMLDVRGRLRLAQGRPGEALADLLECGPRSEPDGPTNPAVVPWRAHAAEAYAALGDLDAAATLAHEELDLARRFGAPRPIGIALRAAGLAAGGEEGIALLEEAVVVLESSAARLELARAVCDLGAAVRRAGRRNDAIEHLRRGLDLAHHCGADLIAERARAELVAAGARPRRAALEGPDALTPSERRVAQLAADGLSNREIAQTLFVTTRTVELHLTHAYAKLGVRSRAQLSGVLAG